MSRNTIAIALALAVLTGIVIGQLTALESQGVEPRTRPAERRLELVRSFYTGINAYLENGSKDFLQLLSPDFQDTQSLSAEHGSAEELVARLDGLRASAAHPVFQIEEMHDLGQIIQVRLSTGLPAQLQAGGFSMTGVQAAGALEFLHVQGDVIVARWGQDDLIPHIHLARSSAFPIGIPAVLTVESALVTLDAGSEWRLSGIDAAWLVVERGAVELERGAQGELLTERESRPVPHDIQRIANPTESPSLVWLVTIIDSPTAPMPVAGQDGLPAPGVSIDVRASARFFGLPGDLEQIGIELARVTVPPGTTLESGSAALGHQLIVIDGAVSATVLDGDVLHVTEPGLARTVRDRVAILTNQAAASLPGADVHYRATGSGHTELLLLTIDPVD